MKKPRCLGVLAFWLCVLPATICSPNPPRTILLWPGGAPGALGTRDSDKPSLDIYLPAAPASGSAVVVVPGGSYAHLALDQEGAQIARWLNDRGVAACYREPGPRSVGRANAERQPSKVRTRG